MGISVVGTVTAVVAKGTTTYIALPAETAAGDVVVVAIADDIAGYPYVSTSGYDVLKQASDNSPNAFVGYKKMGPVPDDQVSIVHVNSSGQNAAAIVRVYRGCDPDTPIDAQAANMVGDTGSGDPNPPSLTTVTDGAWRIIVGFIDDDNVTSGSPPSGFTNFAFKAAGGPASSTASVVIADREEASAGALDPGAFSLSSDDAWWAYHFALRPAPVAVYVKDVVWKQAEISVRNNDVWKTVVSAAVKAGGVWKGFY